MLFICVTIRISTSKLFIKNNKLYIIGFMNVLFDLFQLFKYLITMVQIHYFILSVN